MDQEKSWGQEVEEILVQHANAMNYEHGMQCRILPPREEDGVKTYPLALDLSHGMYDLDLEWILSYALDGSNGVQSKLLTPEDAGGITLLDVNYPSAEDFRGALPGLPHFIHGFFAGRSSMQTA